MIRISCTGFCGDDDFAVSTIEKGQITGENGKSFQAKKHRYGLNMGGFWPDDNYRIIAELDTFSLLHPDPRPRLIDVAALLEVFNHYCARSGAIAFP